ncbi:MAG: class I SAM-dependent methyltransferase [Dysgonamonadaceae bacterium]|jgi:2-polyprenyl-3-methyl-5-hydroxy-6-metoxy-1,4-benzoquinol methylase|nr:class I SAM-dependent methyltransferase [Dysgonamonadaceae bacterium]
MYEFHSDSDRYFQIQKITSREYIIPFIEEVYSIVPETRVLEIGCNQAGVLSAFLERGCMGIGVDLDENYIAEGRKKLSDYIETKQLQLISKDIYLIDEEKDLGGKFDIIVLKDVIEHIPNQEKLLKRMKNLLHPKGIIFFGFPPWQMPFGGHQQMCKRKILSQMPYFHLLPMPIYKKVLKSFGENVEKLAEIKETGISIERFEKILKRTSFKILNQEHYFINPIYKYKFNLKVRKQSPIIRSIPYLRDFFTTGVFYIVTRD